MKEIRRELIRQRYQNNHPSGDQKQLIWKLNMLCSSLGFVYIEENKVKNHIPKKVIKYKGPIQFWFQICKSSKWTKLETSRRLAYNTGSIPKITATC